MLYIEIKYTPTHNLLVSLASALIFSPNLSTVDGGVYGHQAIVFLSPLIPTVDRVALHGQTERRHNMRVCTRAPRGTLSACACACIRCSRRIFDGALPQKKNVWNKWKNHFYEMKGDVGMSLHEKGTYKKMPTPRHKVTHS